MAQWKTYIEEDLNIIDCHTDTIFSTKTLSYSHIHHSSLSYIISIYGQLTLVKAPHIKTFIEDLFKQNYIG